MSTTPHPIDPALSREYLRKRFADRLWDSRLTENLDGDTDTTVDHLVEELLDELFYD